MEINSELNINQKESLFEKTSNNHITNEDKIKIFNPIASDYKDLKEIIDSHNDTNNKSFFLLVRKRVREKLHSEEKNEKILEKLNKLSLETRVQDKKEKFYDKIQILNENNEKSNNELNIKENIMENIYKKRNIKIFSKNNSELVKKGIDNNK